MARFIQLSKLDVAKRQLSMAVRMFFNSQDVVCMHALVANSHDVLRGLCNAQGIRAYINDMDLDQVRPEKRKEFMDMMREAQNYFKHPDLKKDIIFKFYYGATEFIIWDACRIYGQLTSEVVPEYGLFLAWFNYENPDLMLLSEEKKFEAEKLISKLPHKSLRDWWEMLPYIDDFYRNKK